jgi:hypothetical protein
VSSYFYFGFFCGFGFSVLLLLLAIVDYLVIVWFRARVSISAISSDRDD